MLVCFLEEIVRNSQHLFSAAKPRQHVAVGVSQWIESRLFPEAATAALPGMFALEQESLFKFNTVSVQKLDIHITIMMFTFLLSPLRGCPRF